VDFPLGMSRHLRQDQGINIMYKKTNSIDVLKSHFHQWLWLGAPLMWALLQILPAYLRTTLSYGLEINTDAIFFLWSGIQITKGRLPYKHYWDIKPPGIHITAGIFALMPTSPTNLAYLSFSISMFSFLAVLVFIGLIIYHFTGNKTAASVGMLVMLILPSLTKIALYGLSARLMMTLFTLLAIYLFINNYQTAAGASAAWAAAYWQPGVLILLAFLIVGYWSDSLLKIAFGIVSVTVLVTSPFVLLGAAPEMILQTIVAPLVVDHPYQFVKQIDHVYAKLGPVTMLVVVSIIMIADRARRSELTQDSVLVVGVFVAALFQGMFIEFNGLPDAVMLVSATAILTGMYISDVEFEDIDRIKIEHAVVLSIVAFAILGAHWLLEFDYWPRLFNGRNQYTWWQLDTDADCYVRQSAKMRRWIASVGQTSDGSCHSDLFGIIRRIWL